MVVVVVVVVVAVVVVVVVVPLSPVAATCVCHGTPPRQYTHSVPYSAHSNWRQQQFQFFRRTTSYFLSLSLSPSYSLLFSTACHIHYNYRVVVVVSRILLCSSSPYYLLSHTHHNHYPPPPPPLIGHYCCCVFPLIYSFFDC
jgi:hypothetical protein